jgi:mRNA-degrading endonuclease YafQ of YafQ-DinJ toxin-antitoxin module
MSIEYLKVLKEDMKNLQAEMMRKLQDNFSKTLEIIFQEVPELNCIAWQQLVPYFNDGDPCEFSVDQIYAYSVFYSFENDEIFYGVSVDESIESIDSIIYPLPFLSDFYKKNYEKDYKSSIDKMEKIGKEKYDLLKLFCDSLANEEYLLEKMFGSHARVIIKRDGDSVSIEFEEYTDHE